MSINFYKKIAVTVIAILFIFGCEKDKPLMEIDGGEVEIVRLNPANYALDTQTFLIVYNGEDIRFDSLLVVREDTLKISPRDTELLLGKPYTLEGDVNTYTLYKSDIPLIDINTDDIEIPDEPKITGSMNLMEKGEDIVSSLLGSIARHKPHLPRRPRPRPRLPPRTTKTA